MTSDEEDPDDSYRQPDVDDQHDSDWQDDQVESEDSLGFEISTRSKVKSVQTFLIRCFVLNMFWIDY
jgi:hypothetical protein